MLKCLVYKSCVWHVTAVGLQAMSCAKTSVWLACDCRRLAGHVLRYQDLCEDGKSYTRVKFVFS